PEVMKLSLGSSKVVMGGNLSSGKARGKIYVQRLDAWLSQGSIRTAAARNGLLGSAEHVFQGAYKVNSLWPNPRLLIALHSPSPLGETGLRICPAEKRRDSTSFQLISPFSAVRFAD